MQTFIGIQIFTFKNEYRYISEMLSNANNLGAQKIKSINHISFGIVVLLISH